jgi:hypothetical protein
MKPLSTMRIVVVLNALALVPPCFGAEQAAPPANAPNQEILVLRNGQTFEGRITQVEGVYVVDLPDGQIRIKAADVDLVCTNMEDGYRRKRAGIQLGNVNNHLELAQWCLRHGLLGPAATELADATAADSTHPMIPVLRHRLKMALEPSSLASTNAKALSGPSNDELDRVVRSLPRGSVEMFAQSVQPLLVNHCSMAGCHGPQSETNLRLYRMPTNKTATRRITQRNLYSVLSYMDRTAPLNSRLLTESTRPHGTAKHAIFSEHEVGQYKRLVDWANVLAQQSAAEPAPVTLFDSPLPRTSSNPPDELSQEAKRARPLAAAQRGQNVKRGAPGTSDRPADPLDPEVFNRRYAAKSAAKESADAKDTKATANNRQ